MNWRRFSVVLFVLLLTTALFISVVSGQSADTASGSNTSDRTQSAPIDPELQTAAGTTEVVVRLAGMDGPQIAAQSDPVASLHSQADQTQRPVVEYAQQHDGINIKDRFWITNAVLLEVDMSRVSLNQIATVKNVKFLHKNYKFNHISQTTSTGQGDTTVDPVTGTEISSFSQYTFGLEQINAPDAWEISNSRGDGTAVAILDTGVDATNHSSLEPTGWKDFIYGKSTPYDDQGHGTHVSGTAVGNQTSWGTNYGVAPNADLVHGKIFKSPEDGGTTTWVNVTNGIEWSMAHPADVDVISLSIGAQTYNDSLIEPIQNAKSAGIPVVVSAGNYGSNTASSPGSYYNTINVGATNDTGNVWSESTSNKINTENVWGSNAPSSWPDSYTVPSVVAPGVDVLSAYNNGQYANADGTSMAAPHVAGTIALMHSVSDDSLTPVEVENILENTARDPSNADSTVDERYGEGIIDAEAAVLSAMNDSDEGDPSFVVSSASVNTSSITINESVSVTATIENTGEISDEFTAGLRINSSTVSTKTVMIEPNENASVQFTPSFTDLGTYKISINETTAGVVNVTSPPAFTITTAEMNTTSVVTDGVVLTNATVENTGGTAGVFTAGLRIFDDTIKTQSVNIPAGQSKQLTFISSFSEAGVYSISINETAVGDLYVDKPAVTSFTPSKPTAGDSVRITTTVESPQSNIAGIWGGSHQFDSIELNETSPSGTRSAWNRFLLDDTKSSMTVSWNANIPADATGNKVYINTTILMDERPNRDLSEAVTLNDSSTILSYYSSSEETIGDTEIARAVQDWANNDGWFRDSTDPNTEIAKLVQKWANSN